MPEGVQYARDAVPDDIGKSRELLKLWYTGIMARMMWNQSNTTAAGSKTHCWWAKPSRPSVVLCTGQSREQAVADHGSPGAAAGWQASGTATAVVLGTLLPELQCSPLAEWLAGATTRHGCSGPRQPSACSLDQLVRPPGLPTRIISESVVKLARW